MRSLIQARACSRRRLLAARGARRRFGASLRELALVRDASGLSMWRPPRRRAAGAAPSVGSEFFACRLHIRFASRSRGRGAASCAAVCALEGGSATRLAAPRRPPALPCAGGPPRRVERMTEPSSDWARLLGASPVGTPPRSISDVHTIENRQSTLVNLVHVLAILNLSAVPELGAWYRCAGGVEEGGSGCVCPSCARRARGFGCVMCNVECAGSASWRSEMVIGVLSARWLVCGADCGLHANAGLRPVTLQ